MGTKDTRRKFKNSKKRGQYDTNALCKLAIDAKLYDSHQAKSHIEAWKKDSGEACEETITLALGELDRDELQDSGERRLGLVLIIVLIIIFVLLPLAAGMVDDGGGG